MLEGRIKKKQDRPQLITGQVGDVYLGDDYTILSTFKYDFIHIKNKTNKHKIFAKVCFSNSGNLE